MRTFLCIVTAVVLGIVYIPFQPPVFGFQTLPFPGPKGPVISGCSSPFTDNFTRANESPLTNPNWNVTSGTFNLTSNNVTIPSTGAEAWAILNCGFTFNNDQFATVTAGVPVGSPTIGVAVRVTSVAGAMTGYAAYSFGTTLHLYAYMAGVQGDLDSASITALTTGDVTKLSVAGGAPAPTLIVSINGVAKITYNMTGSAILTGQPGLFGFDSGKATSYTASN